MAPGDGRASRNAKRRTTMTLYRIWPSWRRPLAVNDASRSQTERQKNKPLSPNTNTNDRVVLRPKQILSHPLKCLNQFDCSQSGFKREDASKIKRISKPIYARKFPPSAAIVVLAIGVLLLLVFPMAQRRRN